MRPCVIAFTTCMLGYAVSSFVTCIAWDAYLFLLLLHLAASCIQISRLQGEENGGSVLPASQDRGHGSHYIDHVMSLLLCFLMYAVQKRHALPIKNVHARHLCCICCGSMAQLYDQVPLGTGSKWLSYSHVAEGCFIQNQSLA